MRAKYLLKTVMWLLLIPLPTEVGASDFFNERYRGWLWFEDRENYQKEELAQKMQEKKLTPEAARAEIEALKEELDAKRFIMMARPSPKSVKAYREAEKVMWEKAFALNEAWEMANLLYPEQQDLINNPINVHAVKMKRELDREKKAQEIKQLAKKFDLVLFFQSGCGYCDAFSPVLKSFGEKYGFNIEAINMDKGEHEFFKTAHAPNLIEKLGIEAAPTVIAISHDSQTAFELIRGYVSLSELEDYSLLAIKHLKGAGKW
jgi:conjugal transfer pilus assembly protein TraF